MLNEKSINRLVVSILAISPLLLLYQNFSTHDLQQKALPDCEPQIESGSGQFVFVCKEMSFPSDQTVMESGRQPSFKMYLPPGFDARSNERHPVVIHVETSQFAAPKLNPPESFQKALAAIGYIVAVVQPGGMNYKWSLESNPIVDLASFSRLISNPSIAAQYRIDTSQISLSGSDIGGYLALMEATRGEFRYSGLVASHPVVRPENIISQKQSHLQAIFSNWFGADPQTANLPYSPFKRLINLRVKNMGFVVYPNGSSDPNSSVINHDLKEFNAVAAVTGRKMGLKVGHPSDYKEQLEIWKEHYIDVVSSLKSLHMAGK